MSQEAERKWRKPKKKKKGLMHSSHKTNKPMYLTELVKLKRRKMTMITDKNHFCKNLRHYKKDCAKCKLWFKKKKKKPNN